MAGYSVEATPPTTADRKERVLDHQHPLSMSPSPWAAAAPPTPQDSLASPCQSPPTSPSLKLAEPVSPSPGTLDEDDNVLMHDSGSAAKTTLIRRSTPTLITIGPKVARENRMQNWLSEIPPPVSPQERYIQGLNPAVDHPLHPRPLRARAPRQAPYLGNTGVTGDDDALSRSCEKLAIDASDKENAMVRNRLRSLGSPPQITPTNVLAERPVLGTKKRLLTEDAGDLFARKRTRLLDPVRRFSQRLSSSLTMSYGVAEEKRDSEDLSPEEVAKQNEMLYKFTHLSKTPSSSIRSSLSKRSGTFRSQGSSTIRRIMSSRLAPAMPPPSRDDQVGFWAEGRPDMIVNVAFIGDARVGKTALIKRLVYGNFPQTYAPSSIQEETIRIMVDGVRVQLNLSEGGSARDPCEPSILALGWFSVVVLCFDIGHHGTLHSLQKYRNDIAMYEENSVLVLAGLKKDARRRLPPLQLTFVEDAVQVTPEKGMDAALKLGCTEYFECSSLASCEGIDDLYDYIARAGVEVQKIRSKTISRFRFERTVDKGMAKIAEGVRSIFTFNGSSA
ncbi:hypothetical protein HMPREF1624_07919 [Sporothrix schenckii ATCC 58251]|uniref:Uncharacterized protein n=1 Tax=Sporothrix schenckii (strain ATCC 58251 / de Perez 2211183) TaxID=1391915 RepID=U7PJV8_SPOS1|nr:hypothetical protein HMPREF1624_07919 [Sporothrix schenckii ATCC 58251]